MAWTTEYLWVRFELAEGTYRSALLVNPAKVEGVVYYEKMGASAILMDSGRMEYIVKGTAAEVAEKLGIGFPEGAKRTDAEDDSSKAG